MAHKQQKKIILTQQQSLVIHKLLKADRGEQPLQDLIETITKEAQVEDWISEKMAAAWRWNHKEDGAEQNKAESYLIEQPLPNKSMVESAGGEGKVKQIIALAEAGKSVAEIIDMGYNKSTVYRQVSEWRKRKAAAK